MSDYFEFFCPVKIISGNKALENIPFELEILKSSKPLIITDQGVRKAGLIKHVTNAFKDSEITIAGIYDKVPADSSVKTVNDLADVYYTNDCDSIIAVGGGSVMDTAKGLNIVVSEKSNDLMKFTGANALKSPLNPLIAIPTTAGTGSEVTAVAVIADTDKNKKLAFVSYFLLPNVAVIDPRMTLTLPKLITASTAMDAMTHAIEAYTCLAKNPISDAYAYAAINLISQHLFGVLKNPKQKTGRLALANAATMAGIAFSNSMVGMVHTLGHAVGAVCHVPHGTAMSILLPHVLTYNLEHGDQNYKDTLGELLLPLSGQQVFAQTTTASRSEKVVNALHDLKERLYQTAGLPRTLLETEKVDATQLEVIANTAMQDPSSIYNPVEINLNGILNVLQSAYGER